MKVISIVIGGLLAVLTLAFTVSLVLAIVFNVNAGRKYRKALANSVDQLRLSKMLSALGIDVDSYLHTERIVDIQQHMDRCSSCENIEKCDDQISKGALDAADISFCNNEQSLQEIARKNSQPG
jgi:rRNA maturation endonuclease Nob1